MIRLALIGAGAFGRKNAAAFAAHSDRCRISVVVDPNLDAAKDAAQTYDATAVATLEEAFDHCDAVIISSPHFLHPEQCIASAQAGKHCWVEKPIALKTSDADRMCAAVDAAGVKTMTGYTVRFAKGIQTFKRVIDEGLIGDIVSAYSRRIVDLGFASQPDNWRHDTTKTGGVLTELGTHELDWIVHLLGMPQSVFARTFALGPQGFLANDHLWAMLNYADGKTATLEQSQMAKLIMDNGIIGTKGCVYYKKWGGQIALALSGKDEEILEAAPAIDKHLHFLDVIDGRCESVADIHYSRGITHLVEQILTSAQSGQVEQIQASPVGSK